MKGASMKKLSEEYPLITGLMLSELTSVVIFFAGLSVFVQADLGLPLNEYLAVIAIGVALMAVPLTAFVLQFSARWWVLEHCEGMGKGILYIADDSKNAGALRYVAARLCQRDVVEEVAHALYKNLMPARKPKVILAITRAKYHKRQFDGRPWRIMGLSLGNRIELPKASTHDENYRSVLGVEIGKCLLRSWEWSGPTKHRESGLRRAKLSTVLYRDWAKES
jgi:hypothetical protein